LILEKTWRKVEETRQRTQIKLANMQKQEEIYTLRQEVKEKKNEEILKQKEKNNQNKTTLKNRMEFKKQEKLNQIKEETDLLNKRKKVNNNISKHFIIFLD